MSDERVLVLGGSSDMGCELIEAIAGPGTRVAAHYFRSRAKLDALAAGRRIVPIGADFEKEGEVEGLVAAVKKEFGHPTRIVHFSSPRPVPTRFEKLGWQSVRRHLDVQLKAAFTVLQAFLPLMAKDGRGRVVLVLSSYTLGVPPKAAADYVTAKYALLGLMRALAAEYADKGVCVNAVSPSMVETRFLSDLPGKLVEMTAEAHPLKRNARPKDVVPLIRFLLSDEAGYVSGANIPVAGGQTF